MIGFHATHDGRGDPSHLFAWMRHGSCLLFVAQGAIGGMAVTEDSYLSVKSADGAVYIGLMELGADIADDETCGEVISAVHHDVILADDVLRVVSREAKRVGADGYVRVERLQTCLRT